MTTMLTTSPIPNPINTNQLRWFWIAGGVRRHAASNPDFSEKLFLIRNRTSVSRLPSRGSFFSKKNTFLDFGDVFCWFPGFLEMKKTRNVIWRNFHQVSACGVGYVPIWWQKGSPCEINKIEGDTRSTHGSPPPVTLAIVGPIRDVFLSSPRVALFGWP